MLIFFLIAPRIAQAAPLDISNYKPSPPKNLVAGVSGTTNSDVSVYLSWNSESDGLGYIIKKIDNQTKQVDKFSIQGSGDNFRCSSRGGYFSDTMVSKGKEYTYEIRSYSPANFKFSDPSVITVKVRAGDLLGCNEAILNSTRVSYKNTQINLAFDDSTRRTIYINDRPVATTSKDSIRIFSLAGRNKIVRVSLADNEKAKIKFFQSAYACESSGLATYVDIERDYSGVWGSILRATDEVLKHLKLTN